MNNKRENEIQWIKKNSWVGVHTYRKHRHVVNLLVDYILSNHFHYFVWNRRNLWIHWFLLLLLVGCLACFHWTRSWSRSNYKEGFRRDCIQPVIDGKQCGRKLSNANFKVSTASMVLVTVFALLSVILNAVKLAWRNQQNKKRLETRKINTGIKWPGLSLRHKQLSWYGHVKFSYERIKIEGCNVYV